jgi:hypothetical protein
MEQFIGGLIGATIGVLSLLVFWLEHETWRRICLSLLIGVFVLSMIVLDKSSYKNGQIDALKGKYRYEMKLSYEKRLEFSIQDSVVIDSNGTRLGIDENGNYKIFYYQCYFPDTVWETLYIPIDTQFVKK